MRQFVVPQFISVESKVIGPITVRQFILLMVALLVSVIIYKLVDFLFFLFLTVLDFGVAAVFGFAKVNGRPIHYFLINFIKTSFSPKKKVWCKDFSNEEIKDRIIVKKLKKEGAKLPPPKILERSKLSELALVVDTGGKYRGGIQKG